MKCVLDYRHCPGDIKGDVEWGGNISRLSLELVPHQSPLPRPSSTAVSVSVSGHEIGVIYIIYIEIECLIHCAIHDPDSVSE